MKKLNKRIMSLFVCFTLLLGIVIPNYVNADDTITIDLKAYPKMDIVLTINESSLDLLNFENDLKSQLQKKVLILKM